VNWADLDVLSKAGVKLGGHGCAFKGGCQLERDQSAFPKAAVNWSDLDVMSKAGINWADLDTMSKAGVTGRFKCTFQGGSELGGYGRAFKRPE